MILKKYTNHFISAIALIVGLGLAYVLLSTPADLWLIIATALLFVLLAYWQSKRIRVHLVGDTLQREKGRLRYWLPRLFLFLVFVVMGLLAHSFWWAQQQVQSQYKLLSDEVKADYPLPYSSAWQKLQWQLNLSSLPTLVEIPAGSFQMGGNENKDEKPIHQVTIDGFWMSSTVITFEQYDYYIQQLKKSGLTQAVFPYDEQWGRAKRPIINISWQEAKNYTHWLSNTIGQQCRLPSEAEWEYAARAGTTTEYPWGNKIGKNKANCSDCGSQWDKQTAPVASFSANPFGLYDMNGNVWEWVEDRWHKNYQGAPTEGQAWLKGNDKRRVLRGGSWFNASGLLRSANRYDVNSVNRDFNLGFRIVCSHPFTEN